MDIEGEGGTVSVIEPRYGTADGEFDYASLDAIAERAASDAGLAPTLLGTYIFDANRVATSASRLSAAELDDCRQLGERAAEDGVDLPALLDLYLSATWRLWDALRANTSIDRSGMFASALFRAADDVAAALGRGYASAQRRVIRREEAVRRELIDDLLAGRSGPETAEQARRAGFNLASGHRVIVAESAGPVHDAGPVQSAAEAALLPHLDRGGFVATKDGRLVCALPEVIADPYRVLRAVTDAATGDWRLGVGFPHAGPAGVGQSYREAVDALAIATALGLPTRIVDLAALAPFRVLTQDPRRLAEVIDDTLGPLADARGGAGPLVETLEAYFDAGLSTTAAARRLHLSVRAVTYRLERVARLTGRSLRDPLDRFALEVAVRGTRLLQAAAFRDPAISEPEHGAPRTLGMPRPGCDHGCVGRCR